MSREARLMRLGLFHLRDKPEELERAMEKRYQEIQRESDAMKKLRLGEVPRLENQKAVTPSAPPPQQQQDRGTGEASKGEYRIGRLMQWCLACDWNETGLNSALERCPKCGEQLPEDKALVFAGMTIRYRAFRDSFTFSEDFKMAEVTMHCVDVQETIRFIQRHLKYT